MGEFHLSLQKMLITFLKIKKHLFLINLVNSKLQPHVKKKKFISSLLCLSHIFFILIISPQAIQLILLQCVCLRIII